MFRLEETISKVDEFDESYAKHFENCDIQFADYRFIESANISFLVLNCLVNNYTISASYELRLYSIYVDGSYKMQKQLKTRIPVRRKIIRSDIAPFPTRTDKFIFAIQFDHITNRESVISVTIMDCYSEI